MYCHSHGQSLRTGTEMVSLSSAALLSMDTHLRVQVLVPPQVSFSEADAGYRARGSVTRADVTKGPCVEGGRSVCRPPRQCVVKLLGSHGSDG